MISVNDRVCEGFAQCDLNVALALRNTAALPDQAHELIHEGRKSQPLRLAKSAPVRCKGRGDRALSSFGTHLEGSNVNVSVALILPAVGIDGTCSKSFIYLLWESQ